MNRILEGVDTYILLETFFKSRKNKDSTEQEHMSRQYRAWRDYLTRALEQHMPASVPYALLHTASLVGLFTCVFVKFSERHRIRNIHATEVKRGMGGLHGNKVMLFNSVSCFKADCIPGSSRPPLHP